MGFLPSLDDADLSPSARAAVDAYLVEHPGPLSSLERTLLVDPSVLAAYSGGDALRDQVVPYLGERAVNLFMYALSTACGAALPVAEIRSALAASGDNPDAPQVTETEQLLIDWARAIGAAPGGIAPELTARVDEVFQPRLRLLLTALAGFVVATAVFAQVGQVEAGA
ncbi:MAG TPA: hypothetical protein VNT53_10750 [Pseudolysinimonas sp.]|nr:hypothetical protein [Pseudolysinimonas sp.]